MKCEYSCGFCLPLVTAAAAPTQRKGKVRGVFLGGGQLCCPPGGPKGTHQDLCLKAYTSAWFLITKPEKRKKKKRVNSASLKPVRITLRSLPCLCWGCSGCSQANHVPNASNPSAHHPEHQWRWIHATKADCEEGLQVHFCWSWASFTASGGSLLASIYPVTEALDFKFWQQTPRLLLSPPDSVSLSQTLWATASSKIL